MQKTDLIYGLDLIKEKDPKTGKWLTQIEGGLLTDEEKKKEEALKHPPARASVLSK